jgi:hypothetical protein
MPKQWVGEDARDWHRRNSINRNIPVEYIRSILLSGI